MLLTEPIKIVKQPIKSQKEKEGSRVEFKFEVQGTSSLSYQWFKDGVELSEQTNASLILECIKLRDFGCYTCRVSYQDGYGDIVKSSSAVLDVTPRYQNGMSKLCVYCLIPSINYKVPYCKILVISLPTPTMYM